MFGFPTTESPGPSSLVDRWKLSGSCDCGCWDMGCPLVVFGNLDIQCTKDVSIVTTNSLGSSMHRCQSQGLEAVCRPFRKCCVWIRNSHSSISSFVCSYWCCCWSWTIYSCPNPGFAAQRNFAEVIAKGEAQGMVSKFVCTGLGIAIANCIQSSTGLALASFCAITWIHMFCNLKSYQSIQLRTLNPYGHRLSFEIYHVISSSTCSF